MHSLRTVTFTVHSNGLLKLTNALIDILESTRGVTLKVHGKGSMTHMRYFNHNSSYKGPNRTKTLNDENGPCLKLARLCVGVRY